MARLDDLITQVADKPLRQKLQAAMADMKRKQRFGLVFEEHIPETTSLIHFPVTAGATVQRRGNGDKLYQVHSLDGRNKATIEPEGGGPAEPAAVTDLMVVKRFGDPIFPSLTSLGSVKKGAADKPYHAVINGENFHALQLFVFLYEGQVDCIYIDPPYNTGSRDWKYNNRYVDKNDAWRHSKWLSMMEKRLRLAKRLLKPDGVIIVMIDEHEVNHLGMLLERVLPEAYRQMVTIVINPKGVTQERFSRVDEYAFFCFQGKSKTIGRGDDLLTPGIEDEDAADDNGDIRRPRWKGLLRSGTNARRQDRKKMFFPVLIDTERGAVVGADDYLPFEQKPNLNAKVKGYTAVWPIRKDKTLGNWGISPATLRLMIDKGYVSLGEYDPKRKTWAISYLSREPQEQIASGVLEIIQFDKVKNVVDVKYTSTASRRMKTVWHRSRHDAGVGGTDVLRDLLGGRSFSFAKSVYAVYDCLAAVVRDKKDALIMDFFAGSGTTLHATAMLNASDEGQRRCIMVTNNEVEAEAVTKLQKDGYFRGSAEYEAQGVFEMVTRPRCEAVVTGKRPDGTSVPGTHIDGRPYAKGFAENIEFFRIDYLDPDDVDLGNQFEAILPSLWLAAGGIGARKPGSQTKAFFIPTGSPYGVLFEEESFRKFRKELDARKDITNVWIVTDSEDAFAEMRSALPSHLCTSMLYRDYLRNFRINTRQNL
ncbi:MAG: site-specific DNA-methyltransferase [Gemmataceae bacterium]